MIDRFPTCIRGSLTRIRFVSRVADQENSEKKPGQPCEEIFIYHLVVLGPHNRTPHHMQVGPFLHSLSQGSYATYPLERPQELNMTIR